MFSPDNVTMEVIGVSLGKMTVKWRILGPKAVSTFLGGPKAVLGAPRPFFGDEL